MDDLDDSSYIQLVSFLLSFLESRQAYCRTHKLQDVSDYDDDDDDDNNNNNNTCYKIGFKYETLKLPLPGPGRHIQGKEFYLYSFVTTTIERGQRSTSHPDRCTAVTPRSTVPTEEKSLGRRGRWCPEPA
jgi:hypothetical protein